MTTKIIEAMKVAFADTLPGHTIFDDELAEAMKAALLAAAAAVSEEMADEFSHAANYPDCTTEQKIDGIAATLRKAAE